MDSLVKQKILSQPLDQLNKTFLEELFASYHDKESKQFKQSPFLPTEKFTLSKKEYPFMKENMITTTAGLLFLNRYLFERTGLAEEMGYWNTPVDIDGLEDMAKAVNNLVIMDKATTQQLGDFIDSRDRLGFWSAAFLSVSISPALIRPMENVQQRKEELFKQHADKIKSDNPVLQTMTVNEIEKELMGMVRENLKNDPGYDLYRSGDGNLDNNYKTINVMRGSVFNNATGKYDVVEHSLMNGVRKEDITPFANSVLMAAYPSAVGTAEAGYLSKIFLALLQSEHIDPDPDSDCGTSSTIPFTVTKKNSKYILYRYLNMNGKKVLTTLDNIKDFVGKQVQLYSPQCCAREAICGKCAGRVFHNLGVTNIGLLTTQITQKMLNIKLKSKHDLSQNAGIIPSDYIFLDANKYYEVKDGVLINKLKLKMFIPSFVNELGGFVKEATILSCLGVFPVKFYDDKDNEVLSTLMIIPASMNFHLYNEIQEEPDQYIVTYDPNSEICSLAIQKTLVNVEYYINQIYLYSKSPQIPYNLLTELMFRCMEINGIDLTGPSISYEMLARRVCRSGNKSFSYVYGKNPNVDQLSYDKLRFREAVQQSGVLQGVMFQDVSASLGKGLAATLNGHEPEVTPLEKIIKA